MELLSTVVGLVIGLAFGELSSWLRHRREWGRRLRELRIEYYAEWAAGMESTLVSYAMQRGGGSSYKVPLCEKRLLLIEQDEVSRQLIQAVHNSIPDAITSDHQELEMTAHGSPDWDWPPFREAMENLMSHVRKMVA